MHFEYVAGRRYAQFENLRREAGLIHGYVTRPNDVSPRTDEQQVVRAERRRTAARDFGLSPDALHFCVQVHETNLAIIDRAGTGGPLPGCDGAATACPGVSLMTFSADCPLVLAYDPMRRVVGMVHASWRCVVAGATARLIDLLRTRFGCNPADLRAGIGPGAGPCCYEVKEDVYQAAAPLAARDRLFERRNGQMFFNLWEASRAQLLESGLSPERIELANLCTLCHNDVFYSFRREGAGCGHFGLLAALRPA